MKDRPFDGFAEKGPIVSNGWVKGGTTGTECVEVGLVGEEAEVAGVSQNGGGRWRNMGSMGCVDGGGWGRRRRAENGR